MLGAGTSLFAALDVRGRLDLVDVRRFASGTVLLTDHLLELLD